MKYAELFSFKYAAKVFIGYCIYVRAEKGGLSW